MQLLSLRMKNIKTYIDTTITFSDGINCILGLNGGGKSTIIESIGYALFGFSKGKKNSLMIRHGEKQGQIELEFIANDGRKYRIEKTIKQTGNGKEAIFDENMMLFDKSEDINPFVKRILSIQNTQKLSDIFKDVIAVPQGKYVAAFLQAPSTRKEEFDGLLGLNEYRVIWNKLRDVKNYVEQSEKAPLLNEISKINGACLDYEDNIKNSKNITKEIAENEKKFNELSKVIININNQYNSYENMKENMQKIKQKIDNFMVQIDAKKTLKNSDENSLILAKKSLEIVEENRSFYDKFNINELKIKELENSIKEYKNINKKMTELQSEIARTEASIQSLKELINSSEKDIKEKGNNVSKKEELLELNIKENEDIEIEFNKKNENLNNKDLSCQKEKENLINEKNALERFFDKLKEIPNDNLDIDSLIKQKDEYLNIQKDIENSKAKSDILLDKRARLYANLEQKKELLELSSDGLCPIFKTKCNNTDKSVSCEINNQIKDIEKEINIVNTEYNELQKKIEDGKDIYARIFSIESDIKDINNISNQISSLRKSINSFYDINDNDYVISKLLDEKLSKLNAGIEDNEALRGVINEEASRLAIEKSELLSRKLRCENEKRNIVEEKKAINKLIDDANSKKIELNKLEDKLIQLNTDKESIQALVSKSDDVNELISFLRKENGDIASKKDLYLANLAESNKVQSYIDNIKALDEEIKSIEVELISMKSELSTIEAGYDISKVAEVEAKKQELQASEASLKTLINEKNNVLDNINNVIKKQEELLKQKEELEAKVTKCDNIILFIEKMRGIYAVLPQILSKTYREGISSIASNLYRTISKDNYRIEISETYNIDLINMLDPKDSTDITYLSGGEQMSVAIAVRLAMLKYLTNLDIYFLDEPTVNLDYERRVRVGEVVEEISVKLKQMFVISHDDTFDSISQNLIKVLKTNGVSEIIE